MDWYTGNPHAALDSKFYRDEREGIERGGCIEFKIDSLMIDCMEHEDAATLISEHDLYDGDLLANLLVIAARVVNKSLLPEQASLEMEMAMRTAFYGIAQKECEA